MPESRLSACPFCCNMPPVVFMPSSVCAVSTGSVETKMERPKHELIICRCGSMTAAEVCDSDMEFAVTRLQALQRSRMARRRVRKEQRAAQESKAAAKMQAMNRGRVVRSKKR